jgi:uncharacterized membrane protein YfcA
MYDFSVWQLCMIGLIFIWTGFVRSGLGFGGAALGLPLMLLVVPEPLFFLPVIGTHLLFFSAITLVSRFDNVAWRPIMTALAVMFLPMVAGILGLLQMPGQAMSVLVFSVTLFYGVTYLINWKITSRNRIVDTLLLILGGYVSGASLIGAPLVVAVLTHQVAARSLRDSLLMLWFILVCIKMSAFVVAEVELHLKFALTLIPVAAIGHFIGLRVHDAIIQSGGNTLKRLVGAVMVLVSLAGLVQLYF